MRREVDFFKGNLNLIHSSIQLSISMGDTGGLLGLIQSWINNLVQFWIQKWIELIKIIVI